MHKGHRKSQYQLNEAINKSKNVVQFSSIKDISTSLNKQMCKNKYEYLLLCSCRRKITCCAANVFFQVSLFFDTQNEEPTFFSVVAPNILKYAYP